MYQNNYGETINEGKDVDVYEEWQNYIRQQMEKELKAIISEENLKEEATREFITKSLQDGYVEESGMAITTVLPPMPIFGAGKTIADIYRKIGQNGFITMDVADKKDKDEYELKTGIEIGPGLGSRTTRIQPLAKKLICVDADRDRVAVLKDLFKDKEKNYVC